jgi:zinc protease
MLGRLSRLLVEERQLATQVFADMVDQEKSGVFEIAVFPRPGVSLTVIENVVDSVLSDLVRTPITKEEVARFNSYNSVQALLSLQPKFMRADTLAHDEIFAGDPSAYAKQLHSAKAMTAADLDRVVRKYLTANRLVVSMIPAGRLELISKPNLSYKNITPPSSVRRR